MASFRIGDNEATRVEDFVDRNIPLELLAPAAADDIIKQNVDWLSPRFLNGARFEFLAGA